jgi:vitamin K-dependent gamma-carboxylase
MKRFLVEPVDIASLVVFRWVLGLTLIAEALLHFRHDLIGQLWIAPTFHFTYYGFDWVRPWPGQGLYIHTGLLALFGFCVLIGLAYRVSTALCFVGLTYLFLLEQALYLNHIYLICLICLLMTVIPAHRCWSVDARLWPGIRSDHVPRWSLLLLQFQVGVAYVYGGLAKLNTDWFQGEPVRIWLGGFGEVAVYFIAYAGLLFDLTVVPLLCWRKTRPWAFAAAVVFHLANSQLFNIGVFPWFMLGATTLFLAPDWPRRWLTNRRRAEQARPVQVVARPVSTLFAAVLAIYVLLQLLVPLRQHLYPGPVAWTEEGHRFSWRMRLREKEGSARFHIGLPGDSHTFEVDSLAYLAPWQEDVMVARPDMILQFAHHLAARMRSDLGRSVEVRVDSSVALNGRPFRPMIDPTVDLATQPRSLGHADWIWP